MKRIAKLFGIKKIICTEFIYRNDKIKGINQDTFGNLKTNFIKKESNSVYYTDDIETEFELKKVMNKIVLVKHEN